MPDKNNRYSTVGSRVRAFMVVSPYILLRMKMFQAEVVETKHFSCYITPPPKIVPFMGQYGKILEPDRPQMTI